LADHSPDRPARPQVAVTDRKGRLVELIPAGSVVRTTMNGRWAYLISKVLILLGLTGLLIYQTLQRRPVWLW
jgi:hypothetical protein